jgi:DNA-binding transcriptional LysR family regulator
MDFKRLRAFYLVAKHGSLRRAANQLGLTLPTLSVQLKKLESELNVRLFHHLPNKLLITERGHLFLQEITRVLQALEKARATVSHQTDDLTGKVSISMGSDIAKYFAPRIAVFIKRYPRLALSILARSSRETLSLVLGGEVDIGIGRFKSTPRGIHRKKLLENGVWLAFPRNHPLSRRRNIGLKDLAAFRIITLTRNSETRKLIDSVFHRNRIAPEKMLEVGTCQSAIDFVRLGLGVALVHDACVAGELKSKVRYIDMSHLFGKGEVYLIHRTTGVTAPAQRAVINIFVDESSKFKTAAPPPSHPLGKQGDAIARNG